MNKDELKALILSLNQDVVFEFKGKTACINPFNVNKFEVGYDEEIQTFHDIDTLMNDKFFAGMSLNQISEQIELQ